QRSRGFLLGATSGRTTLAGEGLQHQDGSSHLLAATIPNCRAYDPAFAGEMAVIVERGMQEMLVEQQDWFYYVTLMNENYAQPDLPAGVEQDVGRGCYRFGRYPAGSGAEPGAQSAPSVTLMGSGAILTEVIKAAVELASQGVTCDVFSVTSWSELAREGRTCEQRALNSVRPETTTVRPHPNSDHPELVEGRAQPERETIPFVARQLAASAGPIIAASDYVRAVPESIRAFVPAGRRYLTLGTDGFGRSD